MQTMPTCVAAVWLHILWAAISPRPWYTEYILDCMQKFGRTRAEVEIYDLWNLTGKYNLCLSLAREYMFRKTLHYGFIITLIIVYESGMFDTTCQQLLDRRKCWGCFFFFHPTHKLRLSINWLYYNWHQHSFTSSLCWYNCLNDVYCM